MNNEEDVIAEDINDSLVDNVNDDISNIPTGKQKYRKIITECLTYVIIIFLCVFIVPKYIVQRTIVKGTSMENTLHNGDNLLVEKVSYLFSDPERFDIVVFYPYGKDEEEYYVKRVIGLPGETIQIIGSDIFIDGEKLDENYGKEPITYAGIASSPYKLNDNEFFVIGDNRTASFDSRYVEIGPVTREKLSGQVILRMYPFDDFGIPD